MDFFFKVTSDKINHRPADKVQNFKGVFEGRVVRFTSTFTVCSICGTINNVCCGCFMLICPLSYFPLTGRVTCCCSSEAFFSCGLKVHERESFRAQALQNSCNFAKHTGKERGRATQGQRDVNKKKFNSETRSSKVKKTFPTLAFGGSAASSLGKQRVTNQNCSDS